MPRQARMPTAQLAISPSDPVGPPPSSWNVGSSGEIVWPVLPRRRDRPDEQAAEGDDEGRHPDVGDDEALERADDGTESEAERQRDDPRVRARPSESRREPLRLHHGHRHAEEARTEPTDRSMLRDTMMSTMPVAMIATDALWTDRFHRFRGVRNWPPDRMLKPIQMIDQRDDHAEQACVDLGGRDASI